MKFFLTITALIFTLNTIVAQPLERVNPESVGLSSDHLQYVDKAIEREIAQGHIPGAVLAVVKNGKLPYLKAYGNKALTPKREPMSENTIFDIASCTKSLSTAIAAMILVERGELSLRDNVDFYIPNFNKYKSFEGRSCIVRIKHLMTHSSGLPSYVSPKTLESKYKELDINSVIEYVKEKNLNFTPGKGLEYSCLNFITLQYIIEKITGQSLREFVNENIYDVLEMNHTDYLPLGNSTSKAWAKISDIAPTEVTGDNKVTRGVVHDPLASLVNKGISGNAGIFSTASDIAILAATILNHGEYNNKRILSPLTVETMCTIPSDGTSDVRSPGWDVKSVYSSNMGDLLSSNVIGHTGFTGSSITIDRENDVAIILLTNAIHVKKYESKYNIRLRSLVANCVAASIMTKQQHSPIINPDQSPQLLGPAYNRKDGRSILNF